MVEKTKLLLAGNFLSWNFDYTVYFCLNNRKAARASQGDINISTLTFDGKLDCVARSGAFGIDGLALVQTTFLPPDFL